MSIAIRTLVMTLAFGSAAVATAGTAPDLRVRYSAGELVSPAGATALHRRLTAAAQHSCAQLDGRELARQAAYQNCIGSLLAEAVRELHSPILAAVHEARTGVHIDVAQQAMRLAGETQPSGTYAR